MTQNKIERALREAIKAKTKEKQLSDHLRLSEEHLIAALKLFGERSKPERSVGYVERLTRAQETVTTLFREELVRARGPIKVTAKVVGKKR